MIDPAKTCLYIPNGLSDFKLKLFSRVGSKLGTINRGNPAALGSLKDDVIPIIGCSPELREIILGWRHSKRTFIYWDRGYMRRIFATWLPAGVDGGYYRWHINGFQMQKIRDIPDDRFKSLDTNASPWVRDGKHIVIAAPTQTYTNFHGIRYWIADTIDALARTTKRQLIIRDKESRRPLQDDLKDAHALVTHGSNAAVEAVILGCPVFVHSDSAAALVGQTDLKKIETPLYPDRTKWLSSLAYSQFNEAELIDGTLWKLLT